MNHKIANILKGYVETVSWADKISGLTQVANIRLKEGQNATDKAYPISCDIDPETCKKGRYLDLAPNEKKKSVMFFEDRGGVTLEKHEGNRIFYQCQLRLVAWLNLKLIEDVSCEADVSDCGVSGDYVIDVIKSIPYHPFDSGGFYGILIEPPEQVERSVDIFSRYTFNEPQTQYLMFPFDYFALDFTIHFAIACDYTRTIPGVPIALPAEDIENDSFTAKWGYVSGAEGYYLDVATDSGFTAMVPGYDGLDVLHTDEYPVTGLTKGIIYYYRVRSYNDSGESGNSNNIDTAVYDIDGNAYACVKIGSQQWLVGNLRTTKYDDGTPIPNVTLDADWILEDGTPGHDGAYSWYDNDIANKAVYGAHYNWYVLTNAKGISYIQKDGVVQADWRVPNNTDWAKLRDENGSGDGTSGYGIFKEVGLVHWNAPNTGAINTTGFTAVAGGERQAAFSNMGNFCEFWSTTDSFPDRAYGWMLGNDPDSLAFGMNELKYYGFTVRLVRDV